MAVNLLEVKDKVQRYLTDILNSVQVDKDGDYTFRHGSSRIYVKVGQLNDDYSYVKVFSPTNFKISASEEFYKYIALEANNYIFTRLSVQNQNDGNVVILSYTMLGEFLDPDELRLAIGMVANTADDIDNEIQDKFGGELYYQE